MPEFPALLAIHLQLQPIYGEYRPRMIGLHVFMSALLVAEKRVRMKTPFYLLLSDPWKISARALPSSGAAEIVFGKKYRLADFAKAKGGKMIWVFFLR